MGFTERFCELLELRGMTAYALAKDSGINERIVGHWKVGERNPSMENLIRLADYFNVSIDYLVGRSDDPAMK